MLIEMTVLVVVMGLLMWFMTRGAKKAQQAQMEQRAQSVVVGNNVVTSSGFFGKIVDIDGDAVTLESPSGDETVWLKQYIVAQMDLPLAMDTNSDSVGEDVSVGEAESPTNPDLNATDSSSTWKPIESQDSEDDGNITNTSPFYDK